MRAITITPLVAKSARRVDVPPPQPAPGEVTVRVVRVGICGTDFEILRGALGEAPAGEDRLVLGHESLGVVEGVVGGVSGLAAGDYVVATVRRPDGCPNCTAGESDMCLWGDFTERGIKRAHGFLTELYSEKPEFLVKVPPELADVAVLLEPLSVVEKAVEQAFLIQRRLRWEPKRALVLGAGAIGLLATALLRLRGLETFTLARSGGDSAAGRAAAALGGAYVSAVGRPLEELRQSLGRFDFILEATGSSAVASHALPALATNGVMCLVGVYSSNRVQELPVDSLYSDLVQGNKVVFGSVNAGRRYFEKGIEDLREARSRWPGVIERFISRRLPLERFEEVTARSPGDIKTVIEL
ncbi:MAG: glucose 1-dehydrogenase [Chloroflexi bacterium]|nr:glucose 1-dehydrogenase [Chloroflexota bacterium]